MTRKKEWEEFFDNHAAVYMKNEFTRNTIQEVDFIIDELHLKPPAAILDIGCGTGRHAIELARRGFEVTGIDLSAGMLKQARIAAREAGVRLDLNQCDAAEFESSTAFDAAICLCEGAFSLLGQQDDPLGRDTEILRRIYKALKDGSGIVLTALSGLKKIRQHDMEAILSGRFDPYNIVETMRAEYETDSGMKSVEVREKGYVATELKMMFETAGFSIGGIYGGTAGKWDKRMIDPDEYEIMVIARKSPGR
jgi:cyclopropane fatty-acyl-phospholipid synthase-like methyltransferase